MDSGITIDISGWHELHAFRAEQERRLAAGEVRRATPEETAAWYAAGCPDPWRATEVADFDVEFADGHHETKHGLHAAEAALSAGALYAVEVSA